MSSPSETSPTRSVTVSSPLAANAEYDDTASSTHGTGLPTVQYVQMGSPPSAPRQVTPVAPNTTFASRAGTVRARSASPRPRRTITPTELSVAQQRARTAEMKADTAYSSVGAVAEETRRVKTVAEEAIAEARSIHAEVTSKMSEVAERVRASASDVAENLTGKMRDVAAYSDEQTSRAVGDLQTKTREFVEGHRRDLESEIAHNQEEARRVARHTQTAIDNLSSQLSQLAAQLAEIQPARSSDVVTGHQQLSHDFGAQMQVQSVRIDNVNDSVRKIQQDTADNTKLLHDMIVNMENLGDSIKYMKSEMAAGWGQEEEPMETEEEKEHQKLQETLLQEVSSSFVHVDPAITPTAKVPISMDIPVPTVTVNEASSSSIPADADERMKARLDEIRQPVIEEKPENVQKETQFNFDVPTSVTVNPVYTPISSPFHYPGLDGHPRRITPIPMSIPGIPISMGLSSGQSKPVGQPDPDQGLTFAEELEQIRKRDEAAMAKLEKEMAQAEIQKSVKKQEKEGVPMAKGVSGASSSATSQYSGVNRPTIGSTTMSSGEAAKIRDEVRSELRKMFPGIAQFEDQQAGTSAATAKDDLFRPSRPEAIAGSEVSMASTHSKSGVGENHNSFSRMMSSGAEQTAQTFANVQWRPKEPPCYYGRTSEDVHMWTSLVRHYLTFMGGSAAQQVAYAVTLLRDSAHEWFIAYERKNRGMPRDWAQLSTALLERFGSNIRSQEAQSQLMSISQGTRPVREYASQFEMLLGRLDSYDEAMLLNQFVWGLQPELARSVSLHYPKSIAQAVSLAETTELAVKASRRPGTHSQKSGKAPSNQYQGRGQWRGRGRGGYRGGRGQSSGGRKTGGGGRRGGRAGYSSVNYDPLACYRCGVRGHLARDCPQTRSGQSQGSSNAGSSHVRFSQSGQKGPQRGRGRGRQARFSALNVLYDGDGNEYPVDDAGQLYVPLDFEQDVAGEAQVETNENTKN